MTQRFKARIYKLGINPCVDVPKRVSDAFKKLGYIPVKGKLERVDIRATLCPKGNGRHRLYVNGDMRKRAVVDTGNTVSISVSFDSTSRETPVPEDVRNALRRVKNAAQAWESLRPSRRKEFLVWVLDAKTEETRKRRIQRGIQAMMGELH